MHFVKDGVIQKRYSILDKGYSYNGYRNTNWNLSITSTTTELVSDYYGWHYGSACIAELVDVTGYKTLNFTYSLMFSGTASHTNIIAGISKYNGQSVPWSYEVSSIANGLGQKTISIDISNCIGRYYIVVTNDISSSSSTNAHKATVSILNWYLSK